MTITDFDYIQTRNEIIEGAFRIVGALETGGSLNGDMLDQGVKAFQLYIKSLTNKGLFLWSFEQSSFATVSGQEDYTTADLTGDDDAILGLDKAWVVVDSEDIQLEVVSWSRYQDIVDKTTNSGRPIVIAFRPTPEPAFHIWPSPDAAYTIKTLATYPLKDFDAASDTGDFPSRFQRALKYGLAEDLFDEYPGPMNEREYVKGKAAELLYEAKNLNVQRETTSEVEGLF